MSNPNTELVWHKCKYVNNTLEHDGTWIEGCWYYWMDHYRRVFVARLKGDEWFHYFTAPIRESTVDETFVAFAEIPEAEYPKNMEVKDE